MKNIKKLKSKINKKMKENKAITLVALVITVIILLILAGITINTLSNSGLFEKAKEARDKWQNAQDYEEMQIAKYSNEIDSYVGGGRDKDVFDMLKEYNLTIEEITRNTSSAGETTITNVNNYKCYYLTNIWLNYSGFNYSSVLNNLSVSSTNSNIVNLGDSCYDNGESGGVSRNYLIFPDGSGNNIVLSLQGDGMTLYGIK